VTLLRRVLLWQAATWAVSGIALVAVPRFLLVDVFDQVPYRDYAFVRVAGVMAIALAMLMTITGQKLEDTWVYCWTFVFAEAGLFAVGVANALWGRPEGSGALLWWLLGAVGFVFELGLLVGLAKTGTERPVI
jgi:hypothetical protein